MSTNRLCVNNQSNLNRTCTVTPIIDTSTRGIDVEAPQLTDRSEDGAWNVLIHVCWDCAERRYAGGAELLQAGTLTCRIALSGEFETAQEAAKSLRGRAKAFIEDWRQREHYADSDFSEL